jgi:hypothetical protein
LNLKGNRDRVSCPTDILETIAQLRNCKINFLLQEKKRFAMRGILVFENGKPYISLEPFKRACSA